MCGILGYIGEEPAANVLLECLRDIAYRGYDSCGIALPGGAEVEIIKTAGSPDTLAARMSHSEWSQEMGIAHTRWATHGEPSDKNAHPHTDCARTLAVAHNGIIENFMELRSRLVGAGHVFTSETDSEVIAHLMEEEVSRGEDIQQAARLTALQLEGAYAFVAIQAGDPDNIVGVRLDCPLLIATGPDNVVMFTSDAAAVLDRCSEVVILGNGQIGAISKAGIIVTDLIGNTMDHHTTKLDWNQEKAQRGGFEHFMLKEIHEQPTVVRDLLRERLSHRGSTYLPELDRLVPHDVHQIVVAACGTASYAAAFAKVVLEEVTGLPVLAEIGSEFRYSRNFLSPNSLFIAISQSGETADTIAALREAKRAGAPVLGVVNVVGTTLAREADGVLYTRGGPEAAVPSTKVFMNQLVAMDLIALHLAGRLGNRDEAAELADGLSRLPGALEQALDLKQDMKSLAEEYYVRQNWFVIGRGADEPLAREAALKLKEVSYIHAESMPAGELKHGPIALIEEGMPVVALVTQPRTRTKMANNVQEVAARRGAVIAISSLRDSAIEEVAEQSFLIPRISSLVDPITMAVPLQLLSYYCGVKRGANVDYPRNLAKSVTVE